MAFGLPSLADIHSADGVDDRDIHLDVDLARLDRRRGCARRLGRAGEDGRRLRLPAAADLDRDGGAQAHASARGDLLRLLVRVAQRARLGLRLRL
jgi:hypothetical protein